MANSFIIGAYWGSRAEPLQEVRNKILQTLKGLSETDEQFVSWYEGGMSRKESLEKKITLDNETIERICLEMVKKGELDEKGFAKMGFLFGVWTGHDEDEASNISISVGTASKWLTNSCVITIPFEGTARERLLRIDRVKKIIAMLVEIWDPDYAVLTSDTLRDKLDVGNRIGWITYRSSIRGVPKITNGVVYEKLNKGHLFIVSPYVRNGTDSSINELLQLKSYLDR
jgi:hypothetical protein